MKIRFLLHNIYGEGGGVLTVTFNLARELAKRHEVEIVSVFRTATVPVVQPPHDVEIRSLVDLRPRARSARGRLRAWAMRRPSRIMNRGDKRHRQHSIYSELQLIRYLRSVRGGALVGMQPGINVAIARFGRRRCVRVVQDHRPFRSRPQALLDDYQKYVPRLDAFLTLTERDAVHARERLGPGVHVQVVSNATPVYDGSLSDHNSRVVVGAGRLERSKGFDRLIAAWSLVARRYPDWELRIFGEGSSRPNLQEQIQELGLGDSVHLEGYSTKLQQEMARASLFVLSSRREGFGLVLVEAMSCGVPVVSFDCPTGPREILADGRGGVLVPNNDVDGLAAAIMDMIELGPEKRRELGAAARQSAHERSLPSVAETWEQLLEGLRAGDAARA